MLLIALRSLLGGCNITAAGLAGLRNLRCSTCSARAIAWGKRHGVSLTLVSL